MKYYFRVTSVTPHRPPGMRLEMAFVPTEEGPAIQFGDSTRTRNTGFNTTFHPPVTTAKLARSLVEAMKKKEPWGQHTIQKFSVEPDARVETFDVDVRAMIAEMNQKKPGRRKT